MNYQKLATDLFKTFVNDNDVETGKTLYERSMEYVTKTGTNFIKTNVIRMIMDKYVTKNLRSSISQLSDIILKIIEPELIKLAKESKENVLKQESLNLAVVCLHDVIDELVEIQLKIQDITGFNLLETVSKKDELKQENEKYLLNDDILKDIDSLDNLDSDKEIIIE